MNIFSVNIDPKISAQQLINRHVVKMVVESSQMLANCYQLKTLEYAPKTQKQTFRKYSYFNHPSSIWCRDSLGNFNWLLSHAQELVKEGLFRGFNLHFCYEFLDWCSENIPDNILNNSGLTKFALAMPDEYKQDCPIESYRNYYINDKQYDNTGKWMMFYTNRNYPDWFPNWLVKKCESQK